MEQAAGGRHRQQRADFGPAAGLAEDHHIRRIAAEPGDVVADPVQARDEVEHADVARRGIFLSTDLSEVQIAEDVQAMVDRDDHHVAATRERGSVDPRPGAALLGESATVDPEHHRALAPVVDAWRPDVEDQAVLIEALRWIRLRRQHLGEAHVLRRLMTVTKRIAHPVPRTWRRWGHETARSSGGGAVRHALECVNAVRKRAAHLAGARVDHGAVFLGGMR
jgi:hypothetical protein